MREQTIDADGLRRASKLSMLISQAAAGANMCFYVIMVYAGYIATEGYGVPVVIAGMIVTGTRVFDGITDPIIAAVFDRMDANHGGKIRKFLIAGWGIMALADMTMYNWMSGRLDGFPGMLVFILIYVVHIIGYTVLGIGMTVASIAVTNDPKQRPFMNLANTIYSYLVPIVLNTVMAFAILPRYDNQYNAACLKETTFWYIIGGIVFVVLACIGVSPIDNAKVLDGTKAPDGNHKIGIKEMVEMLRKNKPLRMYVITSASDKLAQQTGSQAVVLTLMNGILIANYQAATMIGNTGTIIGISFAFIGGVYIVKFGAKNATTVWSWASIALSVAAVGFCFVLGPKGMAAIGHMGIPMMVYIVITVATNGIKMILSTAAGTMKADVTDYWLEQTGHYMPGTVGAVYAFCDKLISSLSSTIAAVTVALIGYKNTMPQMGDEATWSVLVITMVLMYGFPVVGWLCNVFAMWGYELDKERMVEVQKNIAKKKAEVGNA